MRFGLPALVRTTTFRLALVHAVLFAAFSAGLLLYLYTSTVGYMARGADRELRGEVEALAAAYRNGGMNRLNQSVIERVSAQGRFYYLLVDRFGDRVSGDFSELPDTPPPLGRSKETTFEFQVMGSEGELTDRRAKGVMIRLPNDMVLLVAYDLSDQSGIANRITRAVWTAAPIGLALSLLGGIVISRSAARRAEALARTTEAVMAGDLSQRAPVIGSGDEFDRLAERLNAMLERVERLMMATRYAGDAIAHDLRSPLTRLRNRLETALSEPQNLAQAQDTLGATVEEVDAVLTTFNSILRLSRVEAGDSSKFESLDASAIGFELADLYEPAAEDHALEFDAEIDPDLVVHGDRSLLAQALSNLLDNAIKYTPEGGAMTFRARRTGKDEIEFSVTDTGPGIPEAARDRVLERFVRLEESRTQQGSGLGLSLVAAVAEIHNGRLELSDGPGGDERPGLRAALILPKG